MVPSKIIGSFYPLRIFSHKLFGFQNNGYEKMKKIVDAAKWMDHD